MPNYSEVTDLLVGDIPLPKGLKPQKYVDDATAEIDSIIGFVYQTPIDLSEDSTVARPVRLLIKRLANNLASGRLILAMSTGGQRMELHAYGASLVSEATLVLQQIAAGDLLLPGVPPVDATPGDPSDQFTGPQIANVDPESNVESFYDRIANPYYCFAPYGTAKQSGEGALIRP